MAWRSSRSLARNGRRCKRSVSIGASRVYTRQFSQGRSRRRPDPRRLAAPSQCGLGRDGGRAAVTPDPALLDDLAGRISGRVLAPADNGFDAARRVHNGLVDRTPAVIIRCRSAADAAAGVRFARAAGLDVCVRGGGHNVAGRAVVDDAVMIDLAGMKGIYVDRDAKRLRAQGGVLWGELNREAAVHGLAVTGG